MLFLFLAVWVRPFNIALLDIKLLSVLTTEQIVRVIVLTCDTEKRTTYTISSTYHYQLCLPSLPTYLRILGLQVGILFSPLVHSCPATLSHLVLALMTQQTKVSSPQEPHTPLIT
ncbi:hypothetical protein BKA57DRAFT_452197 [Linnemannia elongata]|nr:hypothetical protein BKA57DRAFT_452197 [Linnemannia elongata]